MPEETPIRPIATTAAPVSSISALAAWLDAPRLLRSRFRRDLAGTLLAQAGILGIGALTGVLSARLLGPTGRGELTALTLWPLTIFFLCGLGIESALVFHVGKRLFSMPELWTASTVVSIMEAVAAILIGLLVIPLALRAYPEDVRRLALLFLFFAPVVILSGQPAFIFQGKLKLAACNTVRAAAPATYALGLLVLLFTKPPHLRNVVLCQLGGVVVAAMLGYGMLLRREEIRFAWQPKALRSLVNFGWRTQLANVTAFINQRVDQLLLSLFIPPRELGLYVVAVTVTSAAGVFPQAAGIVTYATGANLDAPQAARIIARTVQASAIWMGLGCTCLFIAVPWAIPWVFGRAFSGSVLACRILLPGAIALALSQVLYEGARALNQPALPSYAEGCGLIITAVCLYLLVPRFGFVGAAIASTLAYTGSLIVTLVLFRRRTGVGWRDLAGLPPAAARAARP